MGFSLNPIRDLSSALHAGEKIAEDGAKGFAGAMKDAAKAVSHMSPSQIGHTALDIVGMVPVVGTVANLANAGWYAAQGDWTDAAWSAAAAIPIEGDAVDAAKLGKDAVNIAEDGATAERVLKDGKEIASAAEDGAKAARDGKEVASAAEDGAKAARDGKEAASTGESAEKAGVKDESTRTLDRGSQPGNPTELDEPPAQAKEVRAAEAGSPEHKAMRWKEYQDRGGGWDYDRWSKTYDNNMVRAKEAHQAVDAYHTQLGWGSREATVDVEGVDRRLDIADVATQRGVEYKTGYQYLGEENRSEMARDEVLVKKYGWDISWVFEGKASKQLLDALKKAGIKVSVR